MKLNGHDYCVSLLEEYGCQTIKVSRGNKEIRASCPVHNPKGDSSAFRIVFPEDREPFSHCHVCKWNSDLPKLVAFVQDISYKKAVKRIGRKTSLGRVSIGKISDTLEKMCNVFRDGHSGFKSDKLPDRSENQQPLYDYLDSRKRKSHNILEIEYIINKYKLFYCSQGRMSGRIIMPINIGGRQVSYNDRSVNSKLKSLHPEGTNFEDLVHGLDEASGRRIGIIVEGSFDMFQIESLLLREKMSADYGVICLMNATLTPTKAALVAEAFDETILLFDHDDAGVLGAESAMVELEDLMPVKNYTTGLPKTLDPGKCLPKVLLDAITGKRNKVKKRRTFLDGISI